MFRRVFLFYFSYRNLQTNNILNYRQITEIVTHILEFHLLLFPASMSGVSALIEAVAVYYMFADLLPMSGNKDEF